MSGSLSPRLPFKEPCGVLSTFAGDQSVQSYTYGVISGLSNLVYSRRCGFCTILSALHSCSSRPAGSVLPSAPMPSYDCLGHLDSAVVAHKLQDWFFMFLYLQCFSRHPSYSLGFGLWFSSVLCGCILHEDDSDPFWEGLRSKQTTYECELWSSNRILLRSIWLLWFPF